MRHKILVEERKKLYQEGSISRSEVKSAEEARKAANAQLKADAKTAKDLNRLRNLELAATICKRVGRYFHDDKDRFTEKKEMIESRDLNRCSHARDDLYKYTCLSAQLIKIAF